MGRNDRPRRVEKVLHRGTVTVLKDATGSRVLTPEEAAEHARVSSSSSETEPVELERQDGEPCYGCVCCTEWAAALSQLRTAIGNHEFVRTVSGGKCPPDCLVCIGGAGGEWQR